MREAVLAQSRGDCDTPMPMHLDLSAGGGGEVHIKSSYRKGGSQLRAQDRRLLREATLRLDRARLGRDRRDGRVLRRRRVPHGPAHGRRLGDGRPGARPRATRVLGILGTGVQARLQAELHARRAAAFGECTSGGATRTAPPPARARSASGCRACASSPRRRPATSPRAARLVVTATASRAPLLSAADIRPGTHVSAVGSDTPRQAGARSRDPPARVARCSSTRSRSARSSASSSTPPRRRTARSRSAPSAPRRPTSTARASPSPISRGSAPKTCSSRKRAPEGSEGDRCGEGLESALDDTLPFGRSSPPTGPASGTGFDSAAARSRGSRVSPTPCSPSR